MRRTRRLMLVVGLLAGIAVAPPLGVGPLAQAPSPFATLPSRIPAPPDNPQTPDKVALGRLLFWDPILSTAGDIACATCHHPDHGYTDGRDLPIGTGGIGVGRDRTFPGGGAPVVGRNSLTILNVAFSGIDALGHVDPTLAPMFWDMRLRSLEAQALEPLRTVEEMRGPAVDDPIVAAVARVSAVGEYRDRFQRVFGGSRSVTALNMARALAAFERSLVTQDSPFDRYLRGEQSALTDTERRGMVAFDNHGCTQCHKGPMLSDYTAHVLGVHDNPATGRSDEGANGAFAFRTPGLRNVADTAPYMHGGVKRTLEAAVGHYHLVAGDAEGLLFLPRPRLMDGFMILGSPVRREQLDPLLKNVDTSSQLLDIEAFLRSLSGAFDRTVPAHVPSGLPVGGR